MSFRMRRCSAGGLKARPRRLKLRIGSSTAITASTATTVGSFPFIPTAPSTTRSAIFTLIPSHCSASRGLTSSRPSHGFLPAALKTLSVLDQHFESPTGGYHSVLPADAGKREQNPHMHLFEAMLAWFEATGREMFLARAAELYGMMAARFFQHQTGILAEYFDGSWNPREGNRRTHMRAGPSFRVVVASSPLRRALGTAGFANRPGAKRVRRSARLRLGRIRSSTNCLTTGVCTRPLAAAGLTRN